MRIVPPPFSLNEVIHAASRKYQVPPAFVKSIIAAESHFSPNVVSPKGAVGLMQLMPETARHLGANPAIPEQNVDAGTNYLSSLLRRYSKRKTQLRDTIAAYNAGPGAVKRYKGVPPYRETRAYVKRVLTFFAKYQREEGIATGLDQLQGRYVDTSFTPSRSSSRRRGRRFIHHARVTPA
ncbi:MAG TPA: lytic transglycosylase domain-containing protein [Bryobacteraceae bacterium]